MNKNNQMLKTKDKIKEYIVQFNTMCDMMKTTGIDSELGLTIQDSIYIDAFSKVNNIRLFKGNSNIDNNKGMEFDLTYDEDKGTRDNEYTDFIKSVAQIFSCGDFETLSRETLCGINNGSKYFETYDTRYDTKLSIMNLPNKDLYRVNLMNIK